ncbi:MAG TPA: dihydrofolate reductase family protein [Actinomycetales bacterium]|nr:dihydrofolate reductase family protein [Actinomycetales bacterium]
MGERPYTVLSASMSIDGYLDAGPGERLLLSNAADLERVDGVRASCDAILVGAATVRNDDPRLLVRSERLRRDRLARGLSASPTKVTVTATADLDPRARFFTRGEVDKLVYCPRGVVAAAQERLGALATVVAAGDELTARDVVGDLHERGVRRLMVEGGGRVHTQFLAEDLADELQLVVAPFFVGDRQARRFVEPGTFPWCPGRRARLAEVRQIEDVALLRYALSPRFEPDEVGTS